MVLFFISCLAGTAVDLISSQRAEVIDFILYCHVCEHCVVCARLLPRRPTALALTSCGNYVVVADKAGDVHRFSVLPDSESSESQITCNALLLGHVSMLLDVVGTSLSCVTWPCLFRLLFVSINLFAIFQETT